LGGAILVAGFGAILLGGIDLAGGGGRAADTIVRAGANQAALAASFRWVFVAAACALVAAWVFLFVMEERPLQDSPAAHRHAD
jgi:hypothetical protein